jgi:ribosomal protein S18 acetylase RimI-like enzyme
LDIESDRVFLLNSHFDAIYESGTPLFRSNPMEKARKQWLETSQVEEYLSSLGKSLDDKRTIAEIWEDNGLPIAYVWVKFTDLVDYHFTFAEVVEIAVKPEYRRRGIATKIMNHVEQVAKARGADVLRSGTGIDNRASRKLHEKLGFQTIYLDYEKPLRDIDS